jgi:carboxyl-terminal processing protease
MMRNEGQPRLATVIICLALMVVAFFAGLEFNAFPSGSNTLLAGVSGSAAPTVVKDISLGPVEAMQEILILLRQYFVAGITSAQETELRYSAIRGLLAGLGDPYTRFMDPEEFKAFREESEGHFSGIGATLELAPVSKPISIKKGKEDEALSPYHCPVCGADWVNPTSYHITHSSAKGFEAEYTHEPPVYRQYRITVVSPIRGGPAEKIGLKARDQILKINGASTFGMGISEAVKLIKGLSGTTVTLLIGRKGSQAKEYKITRGDITIPTVEEKMLADNIGYVQLNDFIATSPEKISEAFADLKQKGMRGLLLDLRNNPGGSLEVCVDIASLLLPKGEVVYIQSKGEEPKPRLVKPGKNGLEVPIIVLINGGSASASEILAGALQDRKVAKLVGERTFGKGLVQTVVALKDKSAVVITTAKYLTPLRHEVNDKGITPDYEVKDTSEERVEPLSQKDVQAAAAIKLLKSEIAQRAKARTEQGKLPVPAAAY